MDHHCSLDQFHLDSSWVTIGSFDGVHLGHQAIIRRMAAEAHANSVPVVVITFYPHPAVVLRGISGSFYLTSLEDRTSLMAGLSVDHLITLPFNNLLSQLTARQFMQLLLEHLGLRQLWTGYDLRIGHNREGTPISLAEIGQELNFKVVTLPPFRMGGEEISSSRIRSLLSQGNVEQAAQLLGRPYSLQGDIVEGAGRGRLIGFPTANLSIPSDRLIPMRGVYATNAYLKGQSYLSVTNIGQRPTFYNTSSLSIETHLLDFDEMIYHQKLQIEFVKYIRSEHRFLSTHELSDQIELDIESARKALANAQ